MIILCMIGYHQGTATKLYSLETITFKRPPDVAVQTQEIKGLDMVRRDWSGLAKDVGKYVLDRILSGLPSDEVVEAIHQHLRQVSGS